MKPSLLTVVGTLGFVAGFVDAAGYLGLSGLFTGHVTGNLVVLGARIARQEILAGKDVAALAFIPIFAGAVMVAGMIGEWYRSTRLGDAGAILLAESAMVALTAVAGHLSSAALLRADSRAVLSIGAMAVVAMGIQNGLMRSSFAAHLGTTMMTTNVTRLSLNILEFTRTRRTDAERRASAVTQIGQRGAALAGFVLGAAVGALSERAVGMAALGIPALPLVALAASAVTSSPQASG